MQFEQLIALLGFVIVSSTAKAFGIRNVGFSETDAGGGGIGDGSAGAFTVPKIYYLIVNYFWLG